MPRVPILHTETRLPPSCSDPVLRIDTTGTSAQQTVFPSTSGRKRSHEEISGAVDEESYTRKYLASESSVYFRRSASSPRAFLWRIIDDGKVVEIQCVDFVSSRKSSNRECWLTFHLVLPAKVIKGGVAFADPVDRDALDIFVITHGNELLTFTLKRDLLTRETIPLGFDSNVCFKRCAPSSFSFRKPYRFRAVSSKELLVSLHDGGLMHLTRGANDSGASWKELYYSEGGWSGTLKGLVPFRRQNTVRYGDIELDHNAAAAIEKSIDGKYVITVSLDHKLRAWNIETGKIELEEDILQEVIEDNGKKRPQYLMPAEQGTLMQILPTPTSTEVVRVASGGLDSIERYSIILHSPKTHEFKFYEVVIVPSSVEGDHIQLRDLQPDVKLIPPVDELMNTNIWQLEEFYVQTNSRWESTHLWLRARSGTLCRTYTLDFDLTGGRSQLSESWRSGWTVVDCGEQITERLKQGTGFPGDLDIPSEIATTPSESWLAFLFYPGRFTTASLETALNIYRKGRDLPLTNTSTKGTTAGAEPLKERLVSAVTAKILMKRTGEDLPDFDLYQQEVQGQWQIYYALLSHLHNRGNDSIGLAYNHEDRMAWSIGANYVSPIRMCSWLETLTHNPAHQTREDARDRLFIDNEAYFISVLFACARNFRRALSPSWQELFRSAALREALGPRHSSSQMTKRVEALYKATGLAEEITEDDFAALESEAQSFGGLGALETSTVLAAVDLIGPIDDARGSDRGIELVKYGDRLVTAFAQETLHLNQEILLDLLVVVIFMGCDLEPDELNKDYKAGTVFEAIIARLRQHELLLWLGSHVRDEPQKGGQEAEASASPASGSLARGSEAPPETNKKQTPMITMTLLESVFIGDWSSNTNNGDLPMSQLLTEWALRWTYGPDVMDNWDGVTSHCLANLIKFRNHDLAADFASRFVLDNLPWQQYLKGRLCLATGQNEQAMRRFQAAAEGGLPETKKIATYDTANLLSAEVVSYLGHGQSKYWQHITQLFEAFKSYSYAIDAAYLALQYLESESGLSQDALAELDRRKLQPDSPALEQIDNHLKEINILRFNRTLDEVVGRIFDGTLKCGRFYEAYDAIAKLNDRALRTSNLRKLIEDCIQQDAVPDLLAFPYEGDLAQQADSILLQLAKKKLASESSAGIPYHQILYAFRMQRANFRGAAEILYQHLQQLRRSKKQHLLDPEDETLPNEFVLLINTLVCCGEGEEWVLVDGSDEEIARGGRKRKLVTVEDMRRDYDRELDRRSDILRGRFPIVGGGGLDVMMEVDVL